MNVFIVICFHSIFILVHFDFVEKFTEVLRRQQNERAERDRERIRMLSADPLDAEAQQKIAEEIRSRAITS